MATCTEPDSQWLPRDIDDKADAFLRLIGMRTANMADNEGATALHHAISYMVFWSEAFWIALGLLEKMTPFWRRANIVSGRMAGYSVLHCCANGSDRLLRRAEMCQILLDYNADIDARDCQGRTPFHLAVGTGVVDCARVLRNNGADHEAVSDDGRNAADRCKGSSEQMRKFRL